MAMFWFNQVQVQFFGIFFRSLDGCKNLRKILGCKDLKKSGPGPGPDDKFQHDPERGQYLTDFDEFGVVEKTDEAKFIKIR